MSQSPVGSGQRLPRSLRKPGPFPLGGIWAGTTASERDGRSVRVAKKI